MASRSSITVRARVVSAGSDEPNALMGTCRGPGRFRAEYRATIQELREGWSNQPEPLAELAFDVGAINDNLGTLFSAGFYHKTFMWLRAFWTASTSRSSAMPPASVSRRPKTTLTTYASRFAHVDVLIVGRVLPALPRRWSPAAPARRCSSWTNSEPGGSSGRARRRHRRQARPGTGSRRPSPSSRACRTSR